MLSSSEYLCVINDLTSIFPDEINIDYSIISNPLGNQSGYNDFIFKFSDKQFHDNAVSWSILMRYNINLLNKIKTLIDTHKMQLINAKKNV